jgi:hypothetical protein
VECVSKVMYCPGAAADTEYGGGQPIIVDSGAQKKMVTETVVEEQETWSVSVTITLDQDLETYNATAMRLDLAAVYGVPPSWVEISVAPGSTVIDVKITRPLGAVAATSVDEVKSRVEDADAVTGALSAGGASISLVEIERVNVTVISNVTVQEEVECPLGHWCATGSAVSCAPGTVAPDLGTNFCTPCEPGTFQSLSGQSECDQCPAVTSSNSNLQITSTQPHTRTAHVTSDPARRVTSARKQPRYHSRVRRGRCAI